MSKKILYTENGVVKVVIPTKNDLSDSDLNDLAVSVVPNGIDFSVVSDESLPSDRAFRAAWKEDGGVVDIDISKAREIQKDKIREARAPLMTELDRLQSAGEDVSSERQRLKDFTKLVDDVSDVDGLKALLPVLEG